MQATGTLKQLYERRVTDRKPYLDRARECAALTVPALMPPEHVNGKFKLKTPFQSMGARGLNNLSAKLLVTILPPNQSIFRYTIDDFLLEKMTQREGMRAEVEEALDRMERAISSDIESSGCRPAVSELLKQLLVAGNILVFDDPDGTLRVFRLDRYVVKRSPSGQMLEAIVKETISRMELPEEVAAMLQSQDGSKDQHEDNEELYTCVRRERSRWRVWQEVRGFVVPGSEGSYPLDNCPWMALRFTFVDGEDYGRSYVEEYLGDLQVLEGLTKAITQAAAASAKVVFLVKPNATTSVRDLASANSGDFRTGNPDDIAALQTEKYHDLRVAYDLLQRLTDSLAYAFLLNSAVQRDGERVTAEEIRRVSDELDATMNGVYAALAQEFQLPFIKNRERRLQRLGRIPTLPKGMVKPSITTGVEALGRGHDLTKLAGLLQDVSPLGPDVIASEINVGDYIKRCGSARGIDMKGLVPTEEEKAARAQESQQMQMMQQLGPNAINQLGGMAKQAMSAEPQ